MNPIRFFSWVILTQALAPAASIWVPDTTNGNSRGGPFNIGSPASARFQQVYSASAFSGTAPAGIITGLVFRVDCAQGDPCELTGAPDAQISFSTTSKAVDALSSIFGENIGPDESVVVARGPITFHPLGTAPQTVLVPLENPFFYDATRGNLLMDVRVWQGYINLAPFDMESAFGDRLSSVYVDGTGETGVNSPTGGTDTAGLVTGFMITPVPEPSVLCLLGAGLLAISVCLWRANDKNKQTHNS